jgi:hypothetical protein
MLKQVERYRDVERSRLERKVPRVADDTSGPAEQVLSPRSLTVVVKALVEDGKRPTRLGEPIADQSGVRTAYFEQPTSVQLANETHHRLIPDNSV